MIANDSTHLDRAAGERKILPKKQSTRCWHNSNFLSSFFIYLRLLLANFVRRLPITAEGHELLLLFDGNKILSRFDSLFWSFPMGSDKFLNILVSVSNLSLSLSLLVYVNGCSRLPRFRSQRLVSDNSRCCCFWCLWVSVFFHWLCV